MTANLPGPPARSRSAVALAALAAATLLLAGCASMQLDSPVPLKAPTQQDITGLKPSGKVTLTETFVGGAGVGTGVLSLGGKSYKFRVVGTVMGPGSVSRRQVSGEIYRLGDLSQFSGVWVEGTGPLGFDLDTGGRSELWLENKAGAIMHLVGQSEGVTLSMGQDELLVELVK